MTLFHISEQRSIFPAASFVFAHGRNRNDPPPTYIDPDSVSIRTFLWFTCNIRYIESHDRSISACFELARGSRPLYTGRRVWSRSRGTGTSIFHARNSVLSGSCRLRCRRTLVAVISREGEGCKRDARAEKSRERERDRAGSWNSSSKQCVCFDQTNRGGVRDLTLLITTTHSCGLTI